MRRLRRMLVFVFAFVALLVVLVLWMAGGVQSPGIEEGPIAEIESAKTSTGATSLDVVVWNVAWGYGWGSEGSGPPLAADHFDVSVERIGETLRDAGADLVLLQEVDFGTTRSFHLDQAKKIAEIAGLRYVAYGESWTANWVPFPYWPISRHYGVMKSGGAILSRFPIESNKVERLEKPRDNPFWYNLFYLFRFLQTATIDVGGTKVRVHNMHLEAFSRTNREAQAAHIARAIQVEGPTIFGGDLNAVPPESDVKKAYPDEPETDHDGDTTVATFRSIVGARDTIGPEAFGPNQESLFTFPAHEPNRKLDYLFASEAFSVEAAGVLVSAGDVSDHLPVYAKLRLR